eukprot:6281838-Prymnesium_polylepis.1
MQTPADHRRHRFAQFRLFPPQNNFRPKKKIPCPSPLTLKKFLPEWLTPPLANKLQKILGEFGRPYLGVHLRAEGGNVRAKSQLKRQHPHLNHSKQTDVGTAPGCTLAAEKSTNEFR